MPIRSSAAAPAIQDPREAARTLGRSGKWGLAAETLQELLAANPHNEAAQIELGNCFLHLKKPAAALACFEAASSEAARLPALFGKAVALQMLQRFDEAEPLYARFLELPPVSEEALSNLIAMSMEVFHLGRVQQYATRLLQISPRSVAALQALTLVAFERRDFEAAANYLTDLQETAPELLLSPASENPEHVIYRLSGEEVEFLRTFRGGTSVSPQRRNDRVKRG